MDLFPQMDLLKKIHFHVEHKSTGSPSAFAHKLGTSRRSLFRILEQLDDRGVKIVYIRIRGCYMYEDDYTILNLLKDKGGRGSKMKKFKNILFSARFWHRRILLLSLKSNLY